MSELPVDALSYRAVVTEYFLGLRGTGLMISPLDSEQVEEWERRGIPTSVVCRGLRRGFEEMLRSRPAGAAMPRTLRACRLAVEGEWEAYRAGRVGDAPPPGAEPEVARARLESALALLERAGRCTSGTIRESLRDEWRRLAAHRCGELAIEKLDAALAEIDDRLLAAWIGSLPGPKRVALGRRVALLAGPRPAGTPLRAHRAALRAHVADEARAAGLLRLRGAV